MKKRCVKLFLPLVVTALLPMAGWSGYWSYHPNDDILPPAPAAARAIRFDGRGFVINGKRTFLLSGSVHYARVPRENWRDILLKLKRAGFNSVETYVFWNYHEAQECRFDFTTESRDLGAFLDTAKDVGLWAIVRVGPYCCAEWENGGFPTWLIFKPGLEVRKYNRPYLKCVDAWFDHLLPIIAQRQIHKGGNVILIQLENEMATDEGRHWGLDMDGGYFRHLLSQARRSGLEVPMYFSGLHHGGDPAPEAPVDSSFRKSPWMSTELWTTWFDRFGNVGEDLKNGERHPWEILARGGNGFNFYMAHGGTNFGYFNDDENASSYDYGTFLGQAGETRELYFRIKRLAYFAGSFSGILAGSDDATDDFQGFAQGVSVTARTGPGGTLIFLDNPGNAEVTAVLRDGARIKMAPGEITGLAVQVPIASGVTLAQADSRILGMVSQVDMTTLVCFGKAGDSGRVGFESAEAGSGATIQDAGFHLNPGSNTALSFIFPSKGVGEETLNFGTAKIRILVMSKETADKTWFVDAAVGRQIVVGTPYLGEFNWSSSGDPQFTVDHPYGSAAPSELSLYGEEGAKKVRVPAAPSASPEKVQWSQWEMALATSPIDPKAWFSLLDGAPPAIGQDGDTSAYAWYSTRVSNSRPVSLLKFKRIGDRASLFVDGKWAAYYDTGTMGKNFEVPVTIAPGDHSLSIFTAYSGRSKFYPYTGNLNFLAARKGLAGPVESGDGSVTLTGWKMRGGADPDSPSLKWSTTAEAEGMPAFYRTTFHLVRLPETGFVYRFATDGLSSGSLWLNGHNLGRYPEILKGCTGIWLPSCWMKVGKNSLAVFDELGRSPAKSNARLEETASRYRISVGGDAVTSYAQGGPWFLVPELKAQSILPAASKGGEKPGPFLPGEYGHSTHEGKRIYIHLNGWREKTLVLPPIPARVVYAALSTGGHAGFIQTVHKINVFLDPGNTKARQMLLVLALDRPADGIGPVTTTGRPIPVLRPAGTVYEAEEAALSGGAEVASDHEGFLGKGFVAGYYQGLGQKTAFTVTASAGGKYRGIVRFANGMGSKQTLTLVVNGKSMGKLGFKDLGDWETWGNLELNLDLKKGANSVVLQKETGDGCVNLDYLAVQ